MLSTQVPKSVSHYHLRAIASVKHRETCVNRLHSLHLPRLVIVRPRINLQTTALVETASMIILVAVGQIPSKIMDVATQSLTRVIPVAPRERAHVSTIPLQPRHRRRLLQLSAPGMLWTLNCLAQETQGMTIRSTDKVVVCAPTGWLKRQ